MANTAITATLGMGYWLLAAHFYTPEEFGRGQAMITAMRLFASLTARAGGRPRYLPLAAAASPSSSCGGTAWRRRPAAWRRSASC